MEKINMPRSVLQLLKSINMLLKQGIGTFMTPRSHKSLLGNINLLYT